MSRRKGSSPKKGSRAKGKHSSSRKRPAQKKVPQTQRSRRLTARQQAEAVRVFAALNRVRRGEAKSPTGAARVEGTTLRAMRRVAPDALVQDRPGGRIRVKPTDRYSAKVQILTNQGVLSVTARGSRQRELAGQHRATYLRVLQGKEPPSALKRYRGKKIGGHELISDYELLLSFAQAGDVGQLDSLYVSPDTSA
jgi:hypothetical protein